MEARNKQFVITAHSATPAHSRPVALKHNSDLSQAALHAEQSRAEQSRAEQSRAEQSRAEQSRAEQSRAEQSSFWLSSLFQLSKSPSLPLLKAVFPAKPKAALLPVSGTRVGTQAPGRTYAVWLCSTTSGSRVVARDDVRDARDGTAQRRARTFVPAPGAAMPAPSFRPTGRTQNAVPAHSVVPATCPSKRSEEWKAGTPPAGSATNARLSLSAHAFRSPPTPFALRARFSRSAPAFPNLFTSG